MCGGGGGGGGGGGVRWRNGECEGVQVVFVFCRTIKST